MSNEAKDAVALLDARKAYIGKGLTEAIRGFLIATNKAGADLSQIESSLLEIKNVSFDAEHIQELDTYIEDVKKVLYSSKQYIIAYNDKKIAVRNFFENAYNSMTDQVRNLLSSKEGIVKTYEREKVAYFNIEQDKLKKQKELEQMSEDFEINLKHVIKKNILHKIEAKTAEIIGKVGCWYDDSKLAVFEEYMQSFSDTVSESFTRESVAQATRMKVSNLPQSDVDAIIERNTKDISEFLAYAKENCEIVKGLIEKTAKDKIDNLSNVCSQAIQELEHNTASNIEEANLLAEMSSQLQAQELSKKVGYVPKQYKKVTFGNINKEELLQCFGKWIDSPDYDLGKLNFLLKFLQKEVNSGADISNLDGLVVENEARTRIGKGKS